MNVRQLIEALAKLDPETKVGVLHDNGVMSTAEVGLYEGTFLNGEGPKMIFKRERRKFVVIGNPGDFDEPAYDDECKPLETVEFFDDGTLQHEVHHE